MTSGPEWEDVRESVWDSLERAREDCAIASTHFDHQYRIYRVVIHVVQEVESSGQ